MVSTIAFLVLFGWPLVVFLLFKRLSLQAALAWSVISSYLLLPNIVAFDPPLIPPINKQLVGNVSIAIVCIMTALMIRKRQKFEVPKGSSQRVSSPKEPQTLPEFIVRRGRLILASLLVTMFASTAITVMQNSEPLIVGPRVIAGQTFHDTLSISISLLVTILPFLLGRRYLQTSESHLILLKVIVCACLAYSILALWEIRFSPQLNRIVYGFHPHVFLQSMRQDGFRPIVFTQHGLVLAMFFSLSSMAAMAIWRDRIKAGGALKWIAASIYLLVILVLCKSLGALIILVLGLPVLFFLGIGSQLFVAAAISATILTYPMLRGADLVPTDKLLEIASSIDTKRALSLEVRFINEDRLLAHANQKPLAGWGSWGRNRVYNDEGQDISITDGFWIIVVGAYGWLGYISQFGLLGISIILLAMNRRRLQVTAATSGLAIMQAAALVDLIPNASITPLAWLIAGALMGKYQTAEVVVKEKLLRRMAVRAEHSEPEDPQAVVARRGDADRPRRPLHKRRARKA